MSTLRVLNTLGDASLKWDVEDANSVEEAKAEFDRIIEEGYMAFRVDSPESGELIRTFDPQASEIIFTAPMIGG